ncbi:MAG: hypothetical protein E1N59_1201 [Puniceicoccaceae bacterium 5H]|nr:MAG: hypothetical protein E1N59_1201 [Puniceicoccaceae bacterium 5H]
MKCLIALLALAAAGMEAWASPSANVLPSAGDYRLEEVATSQRQWTGLTVAQDGTLFVNYPRWSQDVPISVAKLVDGQP